MVLVTALLIAGWLPAQDFKSARDRMVERQLADRGIKSPEVLGAMRSVERHRFVPRISLPYAYADSPLPIGEGQTISQPYIVAYMTEVLEVKPGERILEIGTGSGYQAAILAQLGAEVYSIELVAMLGHRADSTLKALGYKVNVRIGDGYLGWPEAAPFDAIIVTCSPSHIPQPLQDQLKEGGRMIIPVGDKQTQELILLTKKEGKIKRQRKMPVLFVPMKDSVGKKY
ncbi:MAG: protein-L-isoaspartate(D-aspartate) O-methyltransferase [Cyclobacteriaceae bacterium]|nr:protein-L-isoaspartate(D-aspartate) O-methyltransferase [Cyclobacteriaceae bacterium]